jgi:hypothetical protein
MVGCKRWWEIDYQAPGFRSIIVPPELGKYTSKKQLLLLMGASRDGLLEHRTSKTMIQNCLFKLNSA